MSQPHYVILPAEAAMSDFRADIRHMTNHDYDEGEVIKDVFKALSYLPDSISEIEKTCEGIVAVYDNAKARDDGIVLASGFGKLATKIRQMFIEGGAWDSSGLLRLQYSGEMAKDWFLKVEPCSHSPKHPEADSLMHWGIIDFSKPLYYVRSKVNNENNTEQ